MLQQGPRLPQTRKRLLRLFECSGVNAPALAAVLHRISQMQHLVKDDVLHEKLRHLRPVEDPAHDDGVVCRIEVAEHVSGAGAAPPKLRLRHQTSEEALIEIVEYL